MHLPDYTKRRVRKSLGTRNVEEARHRRDEILATVMPNFRAHSPKEICQRTNFSGPNTKD